MINKFIRFSICALFVFIFSPALAQPETVDGYSVQHFTDENGLPQNSINDLLFDKDGYLWLGSQVGLVRFNGSSFKLYSPDDKPVMESDIVTLGKDEKGLLYFQTQDRHLYCYAGNNGQSLSPVNTSPSRRPWLLNTQKQVFDFNRFLKETHSSAERLRRRNLFQRLSAGAGNFFVADTGHVYLIDRDSLYYYDGDLHFLSPSGGRDAQCFVADERLFILRRDSLTAVYAAGRKIIGPARIEGDLWPQAISLAMAISGGKPQNHAAASSAATAVTPNGATSAAGAATPIGASPTVGAATTPPTSSTASAASRSYRLFSCGQANHLLVDHRLYRLFPEQDGHIRSRFLVDLDFIPNISSIEYNSGPDLLLIGTLTEGFYFLRRDHFRMAGWPAPLRERLSGYLFGPMALHQDKEILTDKFIFTPAGAFVPLKDSGAIWQRCLFIDGNNQVWAAGNDTPRRLTAGMAPLAALPPLDADIVDYAEEKGHRLYCLTERSLWRLDSGRFRKIFTPDIRDQLQQNESMAFIGAGRLWIAITNGLIEYDPEKGAARPIPALSGKHVRAIHICRDSSILIGTYGEGYYYYYHQHLFRMPLDKNGFLVTAHCFLEDRKGNVWIPCNKGLFKVPKADMDAWCTGGNDQLYYYYYGRQDGLRTNEFNGGFNSCGLITPNGFVSLLSMKGMVCFNTDSLETDFSQGAIVMAHLEIDGNPIPGTDTIRVPPGYNSLLLEISVPYLGNRNNLYLQYSLPGLDSAWKEMPDDGVLNLSRLSAGNYTLRVRKVNGFGKNNYQYRQWTLVVQPGFFRTSGFQTLVLLVLLVLIVGIVQLRWKLVEKKRKLKESEQALLRTNKQREKLISLVIHDLRSPLRFLTMLAGDLHDNQGSLSPAEMKDRTYWVKKGAQDIYHFSEDFLLWVTSQKDNFKVRKQLFSVQPLLQEIYDFYLEQVLQKGNRLFCVADPNLQVWSDPHLMITIIRNLTDNANKYTSQGEIRIEARQEGPMLVVLVADTGRGMNPEQAAAFLGEGSLDNMKSGSQLGHKFIVDLTRRLNGILSITTGLQSGTTVTLRIPIGPPPDAGDGPSVNGDVPETGDLPPETGNR